MQIENITGVTAAREAEQQRQDRERYNVERKVKRLENLSSDNDDAII
jgi:hypothetical protein